MQYPGLEILGFPVVDIRMLYLHIINGNQSLTKSIYTRAVLAHFTRFIRIKQAVLCRFVAGISYKSLYEYPFEIILFGYLICYYLK